MCRPRVLAVLAASVIACRAMPPAVPHAARPQITLVDSIPYGDGMIEGHLHQVVVVHGGRRDTIPGVLVMDPPVVGPGGTVYGIRAHEELAVGLFAYDVAARRVRALPTPAGWGRSTTPRLAPDGRHVAYLAYGANGTVHAAVAALPGGRAVYRGPAAVPLETGAGVDEIRWMNPEQFEILVYLGGATSGIQRVRGSVAPLVDTIPYTWQLEDAPMQAGNATRLQPPIAP